MLQCKKCFTRLFESNANKEHGELIVICSGCEAKNILAPVLINKVALAIFEVVAYRD
jgi:hypothetical protein